MKATEQSLNLKYSLFEAEHQTHFALKPKDPEFQTKKKEFLQTMAKLREKMKQVSESTVSKLKLITLECQQFL